MNYIIHLSLLLAFAFSQNLYSQQLLEVEGNINLHSDNESDPPLNGDIRWNENANNGIGDFEGYVNGEWCSLTLKIGLTCDPPNGLSINGIIVEALLLEDPKEGQFISECNCSDGLDDDGDGDIDCADSDCGQDECCNVECFCEDGIDNDGDGTTDCADTDCADNFCCDGSFECNCNDGIDNDGNGLTDCDDLNSCANNPCCNTPFLECDCTDGLDNDGDGNIDCEDPDCCIVLVTACACN